MTTLAEKATAAKIGKCWTQPSTGETRVYIDNWNTLAGVEITYYKTGNISSASVDGAHISNAAGEHAPRKVWIVGDNVFVSEVGRKFPLTATEIASRVANAVAAL